MKTDFIRARVEPELKAHVHAIFEELGLTPTQAITLFYKRVKCEHGLPFELKVPNAETVKAIEEAEQGIGLTRFNSADELFKDLGI